VDIPGIERSAVYRINPDNTVETLWSSKEENVYDLVNDGGTLTFSTDGGGRLYRMTADRKATLVVQTEEGEITRVARSERALLLATTNTGRIYRLGEGSGPGGRYESPVHDAGTVAHWGRLSWRAGDARAGQISFETRSGNSVRPDRTWSEWSAVAPEAESSAIRSPNARYIEWRAKFGGGEGKSAWLEGVTVAYLPQNSAPVVKSVNVMALAAAAPAARTATGTPAAASYSITVTDTGEAGPATSAGTPTQTLSRPGPPQILISWQAEDADGDRLVYAVTFRGEDEKEWKLLKENLADNTLTVDAEVFADGRYLFRVVASDRLANAAGAARDGELVSSPVLIDNTPPVVMLSTPRRTGMQVEVDVDAADAASPLRRAEYSLDAGPWTPLAAQDGVVDSPREKFLVRLQDVSLTEHLLVVRAFDAAGNAGLAKVVLR
jgi:hypothetical protein